MSRPTFHVRPNPDGPGWIVVEQTDQEAFAWDRDHYGIVVALENWREVYDWRRAGRPASVRVDEGRSG